MKILNLKSIVVTMLVIASMSFVALNTVGCTSSSDSGASVSGTIK